MASNFVLQFLALSLLSLLANGSYANEISYVEKDVLTRTNSNDVKGLAALQSKFIILQIWSGDPCNGLITWTWILCSTGSTPRVTALYLRSFGLSGTLPNFGSMDALVTIDLSDNYLNGPIPYFLGTLPDLQELNLKDNNFQGTVPASLTNNKKLTLMVAGNADLCASDKSCKTTNTNNSPSDTTSETSYASNKGKKKNKLPIILGISIPIFILFWVVVAIIAILSHKRKAAAVASIVAATNPEMKGEGGENMATYMNREETHTQMSINNAPYMSTNH